MHSMPIVVIGLALSGLAVAFQPSSEQQGPTESTVVSPRQFDQGIMEDAALLGMGEYHCHWTRFRADVMVLFTDAAIEFSGTAQSFLQSVEGDDAGQLLREFTDFKWDELGSKIGRLALANGLDDTTDWVAFARSAGWQLGQRIMNGDNNWPHMGIMFADQAVYLAKQGQDQAWERFGRAVGRVMKRGSETQWSQWGLQVGLQARTSTREPKVDWQAFGKDTLEQARWFSEQYEAVQGTVE